MAILSYSTQVMKKLILLLCLFSLPVFAKISAPPIYSVVDLNSGQYLEEFNAKQIHSIASLTKLMTAYVLLKNHPNLDTCFAQITDADRDDLKNTKTKMIKNQYMSCKKLMQVMLIMSDNWAASALAKTIPGINYSQFVALMNQQASAWGMKSTSFSDTSGLSPANISTAQDMNSLIWNVSQVKQISSLSAQKELIFINDGGQFSFYKNTNKLIREQNRSALLSKTGYIKESGYNLVFVPEKCLKRKIAIVIMGAKSSATRADFCTATLGEIQLRLKRCIFNNF